VIYKKDYRYRKGGFAIVVIAGCDVNCHFVVASCKDSGSTNDIIAWQQMELFEVVEIDNKLPMKYFVIGDEAFTNTNQFVSPWPGQWMYFFFSLQFYLQLTFFNYHLVIYFFYLFQEED
jgi:hypothetical protein